MGEQVLSSSTYETYLQIEAESEIKHEYHDGFILAMAGGTPNHGLLGGNVVTALNVTLSREGKICRVFNSDLRIKIDHTNRGYYPDASVVCNDPEFSNQDPNALTNPILIVEVLSDSTESFDRGEKFFHYRQIPSLQEYVLISQHEVRVESFFRREGNLWEINHAQGKADSLPLKSLGIELNMEELYRMVELGK